METTLRLSHVKSLISDIVKYFCITRSTYLSWYI